jgi:hypothetical protein
VAELLKTSGAHPRLNGSSLAKIDFFRLKKLNQGIN